MPASLRELPKPARSRAKPNSSPITMAARKVLAEGAVTSWSIP